MLQLTDCFGRYIRRCCSHTAGETSVQATERSIIHLDMDCFFASVAGLTDPSFQGKPLAVSHSNSAQGTGEISSANYEARKFGIKASMFIAEAKKRCPHLIVMPYQFEKYEDISEQVCAAQVTAMLYSAWQVCPGHALTISSGGRTS